MAKPNETANHPSAPAEKSGARFTASGYRVADDAIGLVGGSPLVRLGRLSPTGGAVVWAKCEFMNPGGSVKDRPALNMIVQAEREGRLPPQSVL
ncbi:MAG TPA: pyridoxal-phosphate dependent enzyme, partial [Polyangiaceae bacterium]|nr:pyridoxal-phosphate dependent enzyme [Polyangiaceae bacterium]